MKQFNNVIRAFLLVTFTAFLFMVSGCSSSKVVNGKGNGNQLVMDSAIKQGSLNNGMTYFIRENSEPKNRIQLRLVVKAGSCMEDEDQKGVAHFVEHLCFNGTKNFAKSAIVDYFEKIGMSFGPEVNAYTHFEQTVYMLELPADDPEILKTSLLVLHDWASEVSFEQEEIDKERGIIVEEWRLRTQGVQGRVSDKEIDLLLKDSRYAERIPIGDMNIIKSISRDRILDFYKKWYRPENMSVVAVGDVKAAVLEKAIKDIMGEIPASEKKTKLPSFKVPLQTQKNISVMRDKELSIVEAYIFQQSKDTSPITSVEQLRQEYVMGFISDVFNQRCQEKTNSPDALWLGAGIGRTSIANNNPVYFMQFYPKTGVFNEAFKELLDEYERFLNFGVTDTELARLKQAYLQSVQQSYANKDKHPSANYADNIVNHVVTGRVYISEEDNLKLATEIINQITTDEIHETIKKLFDNRGTNLFILAPEAIAIPSEKEITDIWKNYESESAKKAYVEDLGDSKLMNRPSVKAAVTEKKAIKELGGTQYTFANGVKIITKKTDFKKNSISIYGGSKGGIYQLKEKDVPSAKVAVEYACMSGFGGKTYTQIQKIITPKNVNLNYGIGNTEEYFSGSATKENLEETLQLISLIFEQSQFTPEGWGALIGQYSQVAETYGARPMQVFADKIYETIFGKNLYYAPMNKDWVAKLNPETAERVYRERFANPADFTFVFTGDFDEKKLVELSSYYLGNLKTNDKFEETKYVYFPFPSSNKTITVKKGIDKTGYVDLIFGGELPEIPEGGLEEGFKESTIINQLSALFDIRLREVIREDKSGSYGVSTTGFIDGWPQRFYEFYIEFGCEPEREEELRTAVLETIKDVKSGNISDELILKLKESYSRNIETSLRNNGWWLSRFSAEVLYTYEPLWYTKNSSKAIDWITKEALVEAANKYLNTDRMVTAYLKPE